jgi:hypothetical protein
LTRPKSTTFGHVGQPATLAQDDVPGLDVAVHEADAVGFGEGPEHLAQDVRWLSPAVIRGRPADTARGRSSWRAANVARFLAAMGEATELPRRSPVRGPPYWKSCVLRRQALGDEDDAQGRWVPQTA